MVYDCTAADPCFVDGRAPQNIEEVLSWMRGHEQIQKLGPWRLISARKRHTKTLLEIEEDTGHGLRRLIGKLGRAERSAALYKALRELRDAGFRPPERFTVPEPIIHIPERGFLLQERVPGSKATTLILESHDGGSAAAGSARWLVALHTSNVRPIRDPLSRDAVLGWANELADAQPTEADKIRQIGDDALSRLDKSPSAEVPSHGDFHPSNVFIADGDRVSGIDLDKFAMREGEADVGWFLMQTAAFGFFRYGNFECTNEARRSFLETYDRECNREISRRRVGLYIALAFLKNLHFELALLKTGRTNFAEPWLWAATSALTNENLLVGYRR
jgi:aminoglycoside phosphotransferase (APT) family kinase protein